MADMRQLVLTAPGKLEVRRVARPAAAPGAILIKVHYCGICGTDLMNYRGQIVWGRADYPKYPGHELSGTVEAVGEGVKGFRRGDRVVPECSIGCGECDYCKAGNSGVCRNRLKYSNGAMADFVAVPAKAVYRLPDNVEMLHGALIEPVAVGCNAAFKCGRVFGKNVGVIGGGTIGLGALTTLRLLGAAKVFLFELLDERIQVGLLVGADIGINGRKQNPVETVMEQTEGIGLDAIVVASAGTSATMTLATRMIAPLGRISVVGLSGGRLSDLDADDLSEKETVIVGSHTSPGIWKELIANVGAGRMNLAPLVSHVIPLDDAERAFRVLEDPAEKATKVVLEI